MLDGDVAIGQHLGCVADVGDELVGHAIGLQGEDADPHMLGDRLGDGDHELRQVGRTIDLALEIGAPDARVLTDEDDLAHAAGNQVATYGEDALG